jgi:hypothetical protein
MSSRLPIGVATMYSILADNYSLILYFSEGDAKPSL